MAESIGRIVRKKHRLTLRKEQEKDRYLKYSNIEIDLQNRKILEREREGHCKKTP